MAQKSDKYVTTMRLPLPDGTKVTIKLVTRPNELAALKRTKASPVGKAVYRNAKRVERNAKQIAPRSATGSHGRPSGYLARRIGTYLGVSDGEPYADVTTRAKSKVSKGKTWSFSTERGGSGRLTKAGKPRKVRHATSQASYYGRIQNQRQRYLPRALRMSMK